MKYLILLMIMAMFASPAIAQTYQIDWYVIGSGGGHSASTNFQLDGTIGQPIVGSSSSANYRVDAGFWVGTAAGPFGCPYMLGDINNNGTPDAIDITFGVNYLKGRSTPANPCDMCPETAPFYASGDVNGSCEFNAIDITFFVNYLKGRVPALIACADCPPALLLAPAVMPRIVPVSHSNPQAAGSN